MRSGNVGFSPMPVYDPLSSPVSKSTVIELVRRGNEPENDSGKDKFPPLQRQFNNEVLFDSPSSFRSSSPTLKSKFRSGRQEICGYCWVDILDYIKGIVYVGFSKGCRAPLRLSISLGSSPLSGWRYSSKVKFPQENNKPSWTGRLVAPTQLCFISWM